MSFLTEAAATLEYETYDYSLPHSKTVDLIGEEFIKKEHPDGSIQTSAGLLQLAVSAATQKTFLTTNNSLPPLTYTTTTIPTISTQVSSSEENGVLYCNLDDLSRYIPDNFNFDTIIPENMEADSVHDSMSGISEYSKVQVLSLPTQPLPVSLANQHYNSRPMTISFPSVPDPRYGPGGASTVQIQLKSSTCAQSSVQTMTIPTIDTTKLTGQLSVVQELPEVSKLVFQEVKQEPDSIVNILENMKEEPGSLSPLDYTVSSTSEGPLNLVNNFAKGIKRVTAPVQNLAQDAKRIKNVYLVQGHNGQQIIQEVPVSYMNAYNHQRSTPSPMAHDLIQGGHNITSSVLCIDPPSPMSHEIKKEPKSKSASPKLQLTKTINGTTIPSSKTCNWVFENGQVCGKTFSKSYNLVVHMRMHEDIRPFACTLCDQTFRQKAHLQRHETTHGIQTKNFYRTPASKKKKKRPAQKLSKNLQDRLARVNQNLNKSNGDLGEDSEGEEYMEDDEDDLYVPNGNQPKRASIISRKYSDNDKDQANGLDNEMDNDIPSSLREGYFVARGKLKNMVEPMHEGLMEEGVNMQVSKNLNDSREHFQVKQEIGDMNMNIITHNDDDDNSTVQDILQTVNSVPTLEQKLESSQFLNCDNLLLRALPTSRPIMSVSAAPSYPVTTTSFNQSSLPHITKMVESTSISNINALSMANNPSLPANLTATSAQNLPGTSLAYSLFHSTPSAQTNILFTTLSAPTSTVSSSHKSLSFIETSVPASTVSANCYTTSISSSNRQLVIDNIDDHSPEIQAEILNALLADETYVDSEQQQVEELWEEEIFRLNTLPSTWWVSRKRKSGTNIGDMSYYSPQGYCFKNRSEIQDFLQNNMIPKDMRSSELRSPPLPIEQIPIIEDSYVQRTSMPSNPHMDTNSIAQALIANLKPEPIESLKEALNSESKLRDSLSLSPTCSANVLTLSTVS
eukprot:GFUD01003212.1.p1 GENE.GFUD01003212.1~~GFUD01003212.1.p1  ORF type:complete len:961 (+),score=177.62 GFUD01003212.1:523-3405(+)